MGQGAFGNRNKSREVTQETLLAQDVIQNHMSNGHGNAYVLNKTETQPKSSLQKNLELYNKSKLPHSLSLAKKNLVDNMSPTGSNQ